MSRYSSFSLTDGILSEANARVKRTTRTEHTKTNGRTLSPEDRRTEEKTQWGGGKIFA